MKTSGVIQLAKIIMVMVFWCSCLNLSAQPVMMLERDVSGLKVSWDATTGADFILEASNDFVGWTNVNQSVIQEGANNTVLVPLSEEKMFYRLIDDGRTQAAYVGSQRCAICHNQPSNPIYDQFIESGHPYKLNEVVDGVPPTYPFEDPMNPNVPSPPDGWTWDDVAWVIGGANWKARFITHEGWIITGTNVQWNLETQGWVNYHTENVLGVNPKPYNCGSCHTTGWVATGDGGVNQDGQPGMFGSFAAPGVHCEECHGPGSRHVASLNAADIVLDRSSALCGSCHVRGSIDTIPASGGFIRHHEQYNEMLSAKHANRSCNDCHNPHISSHNNQPGAIVTACTTCHPTYTTPSHNGATCTDCHMPKASKSAVAENIYTGDIHTHIFKINPDAAYDMFAADPGFASGALSLSFACYGCHDDPDGVGGGGPRKSLTELSEEATDFHGTLGLR